MKIYGWKIRYFDEGKIMEDYYDDIDGIEDMCADYLVISIIPDYDEPPPPLIYAE